jgi:Domain of unknown function (DUF3943)
MAKRMKIVFFLIYLLNCYLVTMAQDQAVTDSTSSTSRYSTASLLIEDTTSFIPVNETSKLISDSTNLIVTNHSKPQKEKFSDTLIHDALHNMYGDLLNDDPVYNQRYPWWIPATRVVTANAFNWAVSRYIFNFDWAKISTTTWKTNLRSGFVWDNDHFGTNFIGHPHSGNIYFNIARSNGYSFWQSLPFAIEGSLMWEYFGENALPSKNDIINTPISGMFLGEVLYRISSNILDDRVRGGQRILREIVAGILNPPRALNRLTQGKMFRVASKEVYQKEPLNITISAGLHKVNINNKFGTGTTNAILNLQLDYGDPFEVRHRKPFDVFRLRTESRFGPERKFLDNVTGYGFLLGKNIIKGDHGILLGGFQYFDYWNNKIFELGTLGFGVGLISRIPFANHSNIYSSLHFALVPLAGNSTRFGPDTSVFRDYNFGGGLEAKVEETFNVNKFVSAGFSGYYYWIHTYEGTPGTSLLGILKPRIIFNLSNVVSFGLEHHIYFNDRSINHVPNLHLVRTEQKFFLQIYLEDPKRRGKYQ